MGEWSYSCMILELYNDGGEWSASLHVRINHSEGATDAYGIGG
jgi:hypothetical protein